MEGPPLDGQASFKPPRKLHPLTVPARDAFFMVGIASRCPFEGIVMVAYATFFCICAALDLSTALEMTGNYGIDYPPNCHFDRRKSLIFGVEKSLSFPLFSAYHSKIIYYPFRLSEWNVAHGEICFLF